MAEQLTKKDVKEAVVEALEPLATAIQGDSNQINGRLDNIETGIEDIKLRLDNVAYRFEVQELDRRIKILEFKLGVKPQS